MPQNFRDAAAAADDDDNDDDNDDDDDGLVCRGASPISFRTLAMSAFNSFVYCRE